LKFKQATIALALILIVIGGYAASVYPQNVSVQGYTMLNSNSAGFDQTALLALPILTTYTSTVGQPPPTPANSTRMEIYNYVNANPGIQFRAICAGLTLPVGLVQYHLGVLVKSGLVSFVRDGKYKRFFVSKKYTKKQVAAITALRHKTAKRIFEVLLSKKQLSHGKLADELCISSQALTWQMKSLRSTKFVLQVNDGLKTVYSIDQNAQPLLETSLAIIN
jgi:DNA-binding transcriptional ArsR family regulator